MCAVFWNRRDIVLVDFLTRGETVNAERYCETLRILRRAIQNKRRGMFTADVDLLHDNVRTHTARRSIYCRNSAGRCLIIHPIVRTSRPVIYINHPPYSPDLAPIDFHLSLHLKKFLSGQRQRFQNDREAEMSVT